MSNPLDRPRKYFPRNLTARCDIVRGNPVSARPESGVDNSHPGIEFDQRALNRVFFPGLVFDFQYGLGARLVEIRPDLFQSPNDLKAEDLNGTMLFLWYIIVPGDPKDPSTRTLIESYNQDGYEVIRTITSLDPGPLIVVVGPPPEQVNLQITDIMTVLTRFVPGSGTNEQLASQVLRGADGKLEVAILVGSRANYLDENGVIDVDLIQPGQLTESLCSPWQWDFAECGCFYWAGSKPDIVIGEGQTEQVLNFQRDRSRTSAGPYVPPKDPTAWMALQLTPQQMIREWETLPFVVAERETESHEPAQWPVTQDVLDRAGVAEGLGYLATVEHAVLVEYLYACYSINSPLMKRSSSSVGGFAFPHFAPGALSSSETRLLAAANEILLIAIDEMRHFRWVNEARRLLGCPPVLGRAELIGLGDHTVKIPFRLRALTTAQLDSFIEIEAPSKAYREDPGTPEGLYTHILVSIHQWTDKDCTPKERLQLMELIKLIIDEGDDHYRRLKAVKEHLQGLDENDFLRVKSAPKVSSDPAQRQLQKLADGYYDTMLQTLRFVLDADDPGGRLLDQAHRLMFNLHEVAGTLSAQGSAVLFRLPAWLRPPGGGEPQGPNPADSQPDGPKPKGRAPLRSEVEKLRNPTRKLLENLARSGTPDVRQMAQRHKAEIERLVHEIAGSLRRE